MSDVYSRTISRSWRDRVLDVQLSVCGKVQSLQRVWASLAGHPLRMLRICVESECAVPMPKPPSTLPQPSPLPQHPSPSSPSPSPVSHPSPCYYPFQQHQPSWVSLSSPPLSNVISTPQRKRRQDNSPSPPSEDSDETRLLSTP